jgi:hypothetical protein
MLYAASHVPGRMNGIKRIFFDCPSRNSVNLQKKISRGRMPGRVLKGLNFFPKSRIEG